MLRFESTSNSQHIYRMQHEYLLKLSITKTTKGANSPCRRLFFAVAVFKSTMSLFVFVVMLPF